MTTDLSTIPDFWLAKLLTRIEVTVAKTEPLSRRSPEGLALYVEARGMWRAISEEMSSRIERELDAFEG